jgi:tRNA(fMet)-specific endonuclease VapC
LSRFFMLDTDTASYVIKGSSPVIDTHLTSLDVRQVCISAVTRAELRFGVLRLPEAKGLAAQVERFLSGIHTLPWDEIAADHFADVRVALEQVGTPIGIMDTMIAAHARALKATLVTNNVKHFQLVRGLMVENWSK